MTEVSVTSVLLDILLLVVTAGITWVGIYLRKRWGIEKTADIIGKVKRAVQAAELIGASLGWDGSAKKQWVVRQISESLKIDAGQLDTFIESCVQQLKAAGEELIKKSYRNGEEKVVLAMGESDNVLMKAKKEIKELTVEPFLPSTAPQAVPEE